MFAGRYVWWLLTATSLFLIAVFGFDAVVWFTLTISNCDRLENCYTLKNLMMGVIKPTLVGVTAMVLVGCILVRVLWLRLFALWLIPVIAWSAAIGVAMWNYTPIWIGNWDVIAMLKVMPPVGMGFVALALFLSFPLEDEDVPRRGQAAPLGAMAGFAATICSLHLLATAEFLPFFIGNELNLKEYANLVGRIQFLMSTFLLVQDGNNIPGLIMVILFAIALSLRIVRHERLVAG